MLVSQTCEGQCRKEVINGPAAEPVEGPSGLAGYLPAEPTHSRAALAGSRAGDLNCLAALRFGIEDLNLQMGKPSLQLSTGFQRTVLCLEGRFDVTVYH
jgi:hypothetical protein